MYLHLRRPGIVGEGIDHGLQCFYLLDDGAGGPIHGHLFRMCEGTHAFLSDTLCRQLDRGKRIFDLMRESSCDLAPGGVTLGLHQGGDIIEYDDITTLSSSDPGQHRAA